MLLLTTAAHPRTEREKKHHNPGIYRKWTEEEEAAAAAAAAAVSEVRFPERERGEERSRRGVKFVCSANTLVVCVGSFQQCVSAVNSGGSTVSSPPETRPAKQTSNFQLEDITTLFIFPPLR